MDRNSSNQSNTGKAKKTAQSKTAPEQPVKDAPKAMDADSVDPSLKPEEAVILARNAYALDTLVDEVTALFPTTARTFGDPNGANVALSVTFSLDEDNEDLRRIIPLLVNDPRVSGVGVSNTEALVMVHSDARTQDSREPFDLTGLLAIVIEDDISDEDDPA